MPATPPAWRDSPLSRGCLGKRQGWRGDNSSPWGLPWTGLAKRAATPLAALLLALLAALLPGPAPARADSGPPPQAYRCDGDPLTALLVRGPVDDPTLPDPSSAPVPVGGSVVLRWRDLNLQLPRTNNAGQASFSDGKWWWSLGDPAHPRFRLRQPLGAIQEFACEAVA